MAAGLPEKSVPLLLEDIATGNQAGMLKIPGINNKIIQAATIGASKAYTNSYQIIYLVSLAFGGCAIIAALAVDGGRMDEVMTSEIARKLQITGDKTRTSDDETSEHVERV